MANLKELFPEFYQPNLNMQDLSETSDNIIILDTNYLLEVIKSPTIVSKQYVEAIEKIKGNIYIPYLVALEFNFNKSKRKKLKLQEINNYKKSISTQIESIKEKINTIDFINSDNKQKFTESIIKSTELYSEEIQNIIDTNIKSFVTNEQEELYDRLIHAIENKIGDAYQQDWISKVETEGEIRFENKIPPGFSDSNKDESEDPQRRYGEISYQRKYGDLIIWKDIIDFSKTCTKKGKKVIFVTNDGTSKKKNDLLYKVNNLTIGPSIYLMNELQREAKKEFYILNNLRFIQLVNNLSDEQVNELKTTLDNQYRVIKNVYLHNKNQVIRNDLNLMLLNSELPEDIKAEIMYKIKDESINEQELYTLYEFMTNQQHTIFEKKQRDFYDNSLIEDESMEMINSRIQKLYRNLLKQEEYLDPRTEEQHLKNRRQEEHWRNRFKHEERLRNRRIEDKYHRTDDDDNDIK